MSSQRDIDWQEEPKFKLSPKAPKVSHLAKVRWKALNKAKEAIYKTVADAMQQYFQQTGESIEEIQIVLQHYKALSDIDGIIGKPISIYYVTEVKVRVAYV